MASDKWSSDTKRRDGLYVHKLAADSWAIRYRGKSVMNCPCCGKALLSARAARLVADSFFPIQEKNGEAI